MVFEQRRCDGAGGFAGERMWLMRVTFHARVRVGAPPALGRLSVCALAAATVVASSFVLHLGESTNGTVLAHW